MRILECVSIFQWEKGRGIDFFDYGCVCDAWQTTGRYGYFVTRLVLVVYDS